MFVGIWLKTNVGFEDGSLDPTSVGGEDVDGAIVGTWLKSNVGAREGFDDETEVGKDDGETVSLLVGLEEGMIDGLSDFFRALVGDADGLLVALAKNCLKLMLLLLKIEIKRAISNRNLLAWMNAIIVVRYL